MWTIVDKKRKKPAPDLDFTKKEILKSLRSITRDDVEEYIKSCPLTMITNLEKGELKLKPLLLECSNKFTHCVELFQKWYLTRKDDDYFIFDTHLDEFFSFFQTKKLGIFIEEEYKYLRVLPDTDLDITRKSTPPPASQQPQTRASLSSEEVLSLLKDLTTTEKLKIINELTKLDCEVPTLSTDD